MAILLKIIGAAALCLTAIPSLLVALMVIPLETSKTLMVVGMVLWFSSALLVGRVERR